MVIRKLLSAVVLATGIAAFAGAAHATPMITGSISMAGVSSQTSTSITFTNPASVLVDSGSFNTALGSSCFGCVTMLPTFTPATLTTSTPTPFELFTVSNNGATAVLDVTSYHFTTFGSSLAITGTGTVSLTGYTDTTGYFHLTTQLGGGQTTFSIVSSVPEPGTLALFGAGLLGCALFVGRRRRSTNTAV